MISYSWIVDVDADNVGDFAEQLAAIAERVKEMGDDWLEGLPEGEDEEVRMGRVSKVRVMPVDMG